MYRAIAFLSKGDRLLKEDVYSIDQGAVVLDVVVLALKTFLILFRWGNAILTLKSLEDE